MSSFKAFRQIPEWADDEIFTITGKQLRAVQDMFKAYTPFTQAFEPLFVENLDNGKIKIRYEDMEGNSMTQEEIQTMLDEYAKSMASQMKQAKTYGEALEDDPSGVADSAYSEITKEEGAQ